MPHLLPAPPPPPLQYRWGSWVKTAQAGAATAFRLPLIQAEDRKGGVLDYSFTTQVPRHIVGCTWGRAH